MVKVNLRPLADRVIVKPMETEEITKCGSIVPLSLFGVLYLLLS